jgi:hypothetical protein
MREISPELLQAAKHDAILQHMIKEGLPLNRETWIGLAYGGAREIPKPWTAEDEMQVPAPWRHESHVDAEE